MKLHSFLLLTLLTLSLVGCSLSRENRPAASAGTPNAFQPLLAAQDLEPQVFEIDPTVPQVLLGKKGTLLNIPADCFQTLSDGPVEIQLVEAPNMSDLLLLNAQTVSNGQLLETGGVVYVQALQQGTTLDLQTGKSVDLKIPAQSLDLEMQVFSGQFEETGALNWELSQPMEFDTASPFNELVTTGMYEIPFEHFPYKEEYYRKDSIARKYPEKNGKVKAPARDILISKEVAAFHAKMIKIIESEQYAGTYLATREFAERMYRIQEVGHTYGYDYPGPDGMYTLAYNKFGPFQLQVLKIYIRHVAEPLWVADSLAYNQIKRYHPPHRNTERFRKYKKRVNKQLNYFAEFKAERLTHVISIQDEGVDLASENALIELVAKGVNAAEAAQRIKLFTRQQEIIEELKVDNRAFVKSLKQQQDYMKKQREADIVKYYFIQANELGWINVDKFYESPNAKPFNLLAEMEGEGDLKNMEVKLVLADQNSFISGYADKGTTFRFTKDNEMYTQLPMGEKAFIVAIGMQEDQPYLGISTTLLGDREKVPVSVKAVSFAKFKAKLENLN